MREATTFLVVAWFSTACVLDPKSLGQGDDDTTGGETEGDVEPVICEPPCALMSASRGFMQDPQVWAVSLDEAAPFVPKRLLPDDSHGDEVVGATPWGSVAVFYYLPDDDSDFGYQHQIQIDSEGVLSMSALLPPELPDAPRSMQFDDAATVAVMEVAPEWFTGYELWGVRFEDGVGVDTARISPLENEDEESAEDPNIFPDGTGAVFLRGSALQDHLYWAALSPEFGVPTLMATDPVVDVALVGDQVVAIVAPEVGPRTIEAWPQAQPLGAPTQLAEETTASQLDHRGALLVYSTQMDHFVVNADTGERAPLELAGLNEVRWLRGGVLLTTVGEQRALSMLALDGVQPGSPTPVSGELPLGTMLDEFACDTDGQRCIYSTMTDNTHQFWLVDVSGALAEPPTSLFDDVVVNYSSIEMFGTTHATISIDDNARVHVVDLALASASTLDPPLPNGHTIDFVWPYPSTGMLLLLSYDGESQAKMLWRADLTGGGFTPLVLDGGSDDWQFSRAYLLD